MHEQPPFLDHVTYLIKVLAGLLVVILLGLASLELPPLSRSAGAWWAALWAAVAGLLGSAAWARYRRLDELQRQMHGRACQWALGLGLAGLLLASALQTVGIAVPMHPLSLAAALVAAWAVGLCITHHRLA
jgi:cobalamin synthase